MTGRVNVENGCLRNELLGARLDIEIGNVKSRAYRAAAFARGPVVNRSQSQPIHPITIRMNSAQFVGYDDLSRIKRG
ncbi:hypothetical protein LFL97_27400 [Burkholderia sp. JSH-S8]|nr:hypothetical protein LFL97_27400 [Burkholderia sp. JSH-S8]